MYMLFSLSYFYFIYYILLFDETVKKNIKINKQKNMPK